jgi:hypothetical protein
MYSYICLGVEDSKTNLQLLTAIYRDNEKLKLVYLEIKF